MHNGAFVSVYIGKQCIMFLFYIMNMLIADFADKERVVKTEIRLFTIASYA